MTRERHHLSKTAKTVMVKAQKRKYVKKPVPETRELPRRAEREEATIRIKGVRRTYSRKRVLVPKLEKFHSCLECHYQTKSRSVIAVHKQRHKWPWSPFSCAHLLPSYTCYKCKYRTTYLLNLSLHKCSKLDQSIERYPKPHCCNNCSFETHSMLVLMKHSQECVDVDGFSREKKRDYYKCYQFLAQIKHANVEWLKCEKCSYMARLGRGTAKHMSDVHTNIRWYECGNCLVNVEQIFYLRQHVLKDHGEPVDDLEC